MYAIYTTRMYSYSYKLSTHAPHSEQGLLSQKWRQTKQTLVYFSHYFSELRSFSGFVHVFCYRIVLIKAWVGWLDVTNITLFHPPRSLSHSPNK